MSRKYISLFFSLLFLVSIVLPSIMHACNDTKNAIIVLLDVSEEENKESETIKDAEVKFLEITRLHSEEEHFDASNKNHHYLRLYSQSFGDNTSPPPELA